MTRTQGRPLVTGLITPASRARLRGSRSRSSRSACCGGAPTCSRRFWPCRPPLFYVFVYTIWLKRTSRKNIVIGGAAGAVPVLVGWAAVRNDIGWSAWCCSR